MLTGFLLIAALVPFVQDTAPPRPAHRALLVGLTDYSKAGDSEVTLDATSGDQDVKALRAALVASGEFKDDPAEIHVLKGTVTREKLKDGLHWLTAGNNPDDILYFHFSGHGDHTSRLGKTGGVGTAGQDNGLVLSDSHGEDPHKMLMSNDLAAILNSAKSKHLFVTIDACYSGGLTRGGRRGIYTVRGRPFQVKGEEEQTLIPSSPNYVLFSAARFRQPAQQTEKGGAFSLALARSLAQIRGEQVTYRDLFDAVNDDMHAQKDLDQNPVASGELNQTLFSGKYVGAKNYFPISVETSDKGEQVILGAGQVHGIVPQTEVALYRAEVSGAPTGHATITEVGVDQSVLKLGPGLKAADLHPVDGRPVKAVVTKLALNKGLVKIFRDGSCPASATDWREIVGDAPVTVANEGTYDLRISFQGGKWNLASCDGSVLATNPNTEQGRSELAEVIARTCKWRLVRGLQNSMDSEVAVSIRIRHISAKPAEDIMEFVSADPIAPTSDDQVFKKDGYYAIQVCGHPAARGQPAWNPSLAVLQLRANRGVQQIWPRSGGAQDKYRLPLDGKWRWLSRSGEFIEGPAGSKEVNVWQFESRHEDDDWDGSGTQIFKLMATKDPVDYGGLLDTTSTRGKSPKGGESELGQLLERYALGTRGPKGVTGKLAARNWTTASCIALNTK